MACGNTSVSRSGLASAPVALSHPRSAKSDAVAPVAGTPSTSIAAFGTKAVQANELRELLDHFAPIAAEHILSGGIKQARDGTLNISGMHYLPTKPAGARRIITFTSGDSASRGVHLEIETPDGVASKRGGVHTVFDPSLSPVEVLREAASAFANSVPIKTRTADGTVSEWRGISASGTPIRGYANRDGQITTAFPDVDLRIEH